MDTNDQLNNLEWSSLATSVYTPNVAPAPLLIDRGEGCRVYDAEGRGYIDAIGGIAVSALGHAHPALVSAVTDQVAKLLHTSNLYLNRPAVELAAQIQKMCFADKIFFCNSGAEANEAAIKLARRYQWSKGHKDKYRVLSFTGGFHGRTYGALAATPQPKYHEGFSPMPEGFQACPFGDVGQLEAAVDARTAAILVEPIQGEGGVNVSPPGFLNACRDIADRYGALLIVDEVQTGFGRTGQFFAHQHEDVRPDVMCMAKGIAAGLPLGAVGATSEVADALQPGTHNTTYSGNPVACRAGLVVMETLSSEGFLAAVIENGERLRTQLAQVGQGLFAEVRGRGLLVGAELRSDAPITASDIVRTAREHGLLIHVAGPKVVRLAPPLIISEKDVEEIISIMDASIVRLLDASPG